MAVLAFGPSVQAIIPVDDFVTPQAGLTVDQGDPGPKTNATTGTVLGGMRDMALGASFPSGRFGTVSASIDQLFSFDVNILPTTGGPVTASVELGWGRNDSPLNLDLSNETMVSFTVHFDAPTLPESPPDVGVFLFSPTGNGVVSRTLNDPAFLQPTTVNLLLADLVGGPVNLGAIIKIVFKINASMPGEADYTVNIDDVRFTGAPPPNQPPVADAGGPYTVNEGQDLMLDGSASSDADGTIAQYQWDLNFNGTFSAEVTNAAPTFTVPWATLQSLGYVAGSTFSIVLRTTDDDGASDDDSTSVAVESAPVGILNVDRMSMTFFGTVGAGTPLPQVFTVSNTGTAPLDFQIDTPGDPARSPIISPASGTLAPGASTKIAVVAFNNNVVESIDSQIVVTAAGAQGSPTTIEVEVCIDAPEVDDPTGNLNTAEPIGTFGGNFYLTEAPDLDLGRSVRLQRHYDSALLTDGVVRSALGRNWQHNYDLTLEVRGSGAGASATVGFHRGRIIGFAHDGAGWKLVGRARIGFQLYEVGDEFLLVDPRSQVRHFFDASGRLARLEDGRGNVLTLAHDPGGRLARVSDGLDRVITFTHDVDGRLISASDGTRTVFYGHTDGNLTSFTDANGKVATYAYDPANTANPGLLTAKTWPEGNAVVTQAYNADGRVERQTDGAGHDLTLAYSADESGTRTTTITDAAGHAQVHIHNPTGSLDRMIDEAGEAIVAGVDGADRRNAVTDRLGRVTGVSYDAATGLPTSIDHAGNADDTLDYATRTVDIGGVAVDLLDLAEITRPDGTTESFSHDAAGNVTRATLRDGESFDFTFDGRGQVLTATNPTGGVTTFSYDARARLATATDSDAFTGTWTFGYDDLNRPATLQHPDGPSATFEYDALNRPTRATDERGNATAFAYDGNSRLEKVTDAFLNETTFEFDAVNRLTRAVDRLGASATIAYNSRGLVSAVTNRNGNITAFQHDARQRLTGIVDAAGKVTRVGHDEEGRIVSGTNTLGETLQLARDAMGYVTAITDPLGNTLELTRDPMKRITEWVDPLGRTTAYAYTARGSLASVSREAGVSASYTYSELGQIATMTDPNGNRWHFDHTPMGRPTAVTDPLGRATVHDYDIRGRRSTTTFADGGTVTRSYDAAGNLTRRLYSDGTDLTYDYDARNRLVSATGSEATTVSYDAEDRIINTRQAGLDFGAAYDAGGRLTRVTCPYPQGGTTTVTYAYDVLDRLASVSDDLTGTVVTFAYDDAGRRARVTRPNGVNGSYTHDARGLLTRILEGAIIDLRYTLDAAGQVAEAEYASVPLDPVANITEAQASFDYDAASQVSSAGFQHDMRGRLTATPDAALAWDAASRLVAVNGITFGYDAFNQLVTRNEGGATRRYFHNLAMRKRPVVAERDEASGAFSRLYVWSPDGRLVYIINLPGASVSYPLFDRTGSTLALTNAAGAVTDAYAYDAYGRLLARSGTHPQPFLFVGEFGVQGDPAAAELYHMRARWYQAGTGRFVSREPVWPVPENPTKANPYQYALQDPLRLIDPLGTDESDVHEERDERDWNALDLFLSQSGFNTEAMIRAFVKAFAPPPPIKPPPLPTPPKVELFDTEGVPETLDPAVPGIYGLEDLEPVDLDIPSMPLLPPNRPPPARETGLFLPPEESSFARTQTRSPRHQSGTGTTSLSLSDKALGSHYGGSRGQRIIFLTPVNAWSEITGQARGPRGVLGYLFRRSGDTTGTLTDPQLDYLFSGEFRYQLPQFGLLSSLNLGLDAVKANSRVPTFWTLPIDNLTVEPEGPAGDFIGISGDLR